jgi:outer membrane immunogenic protein
MIWEAVFMKKIFAFVSVVAAFAATPALAEPVKGPRVEAKVGMDATSMGFVGWNLSQSSLTYGGEIGYDMPAGKKVSLGVDAEITGSTTGTGSGLPSLKLGRDLYAGGRVTVSAAPNLNLYAKVGYVNGQIRQGDPA